MSSSSGDTVARKRKSTAARAPDAHVQPGGDERDSGEERHDGQQPQRDLRLADDRAREPGQHAEELVAQIRPGEDRRAALHG